ncbi:MAG: uracil-DNA glycosylase [Eubacteriales bacterium]|nr:uracil-DNA glycosylase [Eubacteriales bacterium]
MIKISWESLNRQILSCTACPLHLNITNKVPGQGNPKADIMIIGEGPGYREDIEGFAFVGPAGHLLTKMLAAIDIERKDVFICNIVKCRPPNNRVPTFSEAEACKNFLRAQLALVKPKIIVLMGSVALKNTIAPQGSITAMRGKWINIKDVWFMPTFHPAALLRDESKKRAAWEDMKLIRQKLEEINGKV